MRSGLNSAVAVVLAYAFAGAPGQGMAQTLTTSGDLPGGGFASAAFAVSADGLVIVGMGWGEKGDEAFRWSNASGMKGLGDLPGGRDLNSELARLSKDLSDESVKVTVKVGKGGEFSSRALDVSADGSVIIGSSFRSRQGFRWTEDGDMEGLGHLPGGNRTWGFGISADGSVIVGAGYSDRGMEAFRWSAKKGLEGLGDFPGGRFHSTAYGVSADGSVIVGYGYADKGQRAFRWTPAGGLQKIGELPGEFRHSKARAVSADGSLVVGNIVWENPPQVVVERRTSIFAGHEGVRWTE